MGTTILLGIISIGILIFIHELGHFIAARASGIRVEVFSIGWGKGILSFKWKETKVQIGWIPFGGYCKMAGDSPRDVLSGRPDEYYSSSPLKRILVASCGPISNYIFAVLLFTLIIIIGYEIRTFPNKIVLASPEETLFSGQATPARRAGFMDGDIILYINGVKINNWDDITEQIVRNPLRSLEVTVLRGTELKKLFVIPELDEETGRGLIGIHPWVEPIVGGVLPDQPAQRAGIKEGDRIVAVDGIPIRHHVDFYEAIRGKSWKDVSLTIQRGDTLLEVNIMPEKVDDYDSAGLFFKQLTYHSEHYTLPVAIEKGWIKSFEGIKDTIRGIALVLSGRVRARSAVAGPARLIYISGMIAREGFIYFLQVMSYISLAFFVMNLIPFPALDGSHIVISLFEIISGRKPNLEVIYKIQTFGFIFLIVVLIFITMNDISSFFGR
ncbi:MAG: RIP metalloprotease RseP [Spirochaetota bacterium]